MHIVSQLQCLRNPRGGTMVQIEQEVIFLKQFSLGEHLLWDLHCCSGIWKWAPSWCFERSVCHWYGKGWIFGHGWMEGFSLSFLVCDLRISALIPWKIIVAMTMEWVNLSIRGVRRGNSHNKQILNYVKQLIFSKYVNLYKIQKAQSSLLYFLTFSFLA